MSSKCLGIIGISLVALTGSVWAGAIIEVTLQEFDFGRKVKNEEIYDFSFSVKNAGNEVLKIEKVQPGCGCTSVEMGKKELAPGEVTELKGKLKTAHFEGPTQKSLMLYSNDEKQKVRILTLKITLPFAQSGPRLWPAGGRYPVHIRDGLLRALVWVENCDGDKTYAVTKVDLPAGWSCRTPLPVMVKPEIREKLELTRPETENPKDAVKNLTFTVYTDALDGTALKGVLFYFEPLLTKPAVLSPAMDTAGNVPKAVPATK